MNVLSMPSMQSLDTTASTHSELVVPAVNSPQALTSSYAVEVGQTLFGSFFSAWQEAGGDESTVTSLPVEMGAPCESECLSFLGNTSQHASALPEVDQSHGLMQSIALPQIQLVQPASTDLFRQQSNAQLMAQPLLQAPSWSVIQAQIPASTLAHPALVAADSVQQERTGEHLPTQASVLDTVAEMSAESNYLPMGHLSGLSRGMPAAHAEPLAAAHVAPAQGLPVPMHKGATAFVQALSQRIQFQQAQGLDVATVRLDPPQMGSLEIRVRHDVFGVQVQMLASSNEVARQLVGVAEQLRQELLQRSSDASVTVASSRFAHAGHGQSEQQRQGKHPSRDSEVGQALQAWEASGLI